MAGLLTKRKGKKGFQEVQDLLLEILRQGRSKLRMAARLLGRIGSASVAGKIAGILRASGDAGRRFHCATALGLLAAEEAVPILLSCLRDKTPRVRRGAATALGRIGAPQALDVLIHCLQDAAPDVRGSAATALGRIGAPQAVDGLLRCLQDPASNVRGGVATALGRIGAPQAVDGLLRCLQDPASNVRGSAATALGRIGAPQAVDALVRCLQDPASNVRGSAATALGRIGAPRATEPLSKLLQDSDVDNRRSAELALTRLASEHPNPKFVQAIGGVLRHLVAAPRNLSVFIARVLLLSAFRSDCVETIRTNLELVTTELGDSDGIWAPYHAALAYLESNRDPAVLDRQNPEMREAIELLVGPRGGGQRLRAAS